MLLMLFCSSSQKKIFFFFFLNALFAISRTSLALMLIYRRYKSFDDGDYSTGFILGGERDFSFH